jgi:hypothetical protein
MQRTSSTMMEQQQHSRNKGSPTTCQINLLYWDRQILLHSTTFYFTVCSLNVTVKISPSSRLQSNG